MEPLTIPSDAVQVLICPRHGAQLRRHFIQVEEAGELRTRELLLCAFCLQERAGSEDEASEVSNDG